MPELFLFYIPIYIYTPFTLNPKFKLIEEKTHTFGWTKLKHPLQEHLFKSSTNSKVESVEATLLMHHRRPLGQQIRRISNNLRHAQHILQRNLFRLLLPAQL